MYGVLIRECVYLGVSQLSGTPAHSKFNKVPDTKDNLPDTHETYYGVDRSVLHKIIQGRGLVVLKTGCHKAPDKPS